jgi:lysophospholipase L1-like esterase
VSADLLRRIATCHPPNDVRGLIVTVLLAAWCACGNGRPPEGRGATTEVALPVAARPSVVGAAVAVAPNASAGVPAPVPPVGNAPLSTPSGYLYGAERLSGVFEALETLESGRSKEDVRVVQYGDSHTASDLAVSVLRRQLQARFGDGGRGFVSMGKPWRTYAQDGISGGMTSGFSPRRPNAERGRAAADEDYDGLLGVAIDAERSGSRAWTHVDAPWSRVELSYWQQPGGGSFDVFIDGRVAGRVETKGAPADSGYAPFEVTEGPHDVELRTVGDGPVRVFGMSLDRPQPGVMVDALGINGAQIFTPLRWSEEPFARQLRRRAPDLVILAYGTNEALDKKLSLEDYEKALVELLGRVSRAVPSASCLLLGPPDLARQGAGHEGWVTWPPLLDVIAVQKRVASAAGCAYYDQLQAMGGPGSMAAWASEPEPRGRRDHVHLTRTGYAQLGTVFATDLLRAYDLWHAQPRRTWGLATR